MVSEDHRLLAERLSKMLIKNKLLLAKKLFVTGCVFPDHNPVTYLRGLYMGHPLKTHFFFLCYPEILRLCNKLDNKKTLYIWDYYTLGALIHYVADAFTFPHNEHYKGNMLQHAQYEHNQLHNTFKEYLIKDFNIDISDKSDTLPLAIIFFELHTAYINTKASPLCDTKYICNICTIICERILEKENISYKTKLKKRVV